MGYIFNLFGVGGGIITFILWENEYLIFFFKFWKTTTEKKWPYFNIDALIIKPNRLHKYFLLEVSYMPRSAISN